MSRSARRIPTVNLSHYRSGTPQERARFVQVFGDAIKEFGFVTVEGHGIEDGLIRRTYSDVEKFFQLPEDVKSRYAVPERPGQRGFMAFGQEHAKNRKVGDLKEFWHVGRELDAGHPYLADYGANVWPKEVPSFREHTLNLYRELDGAATVMLQALAEYFELPRTTFSDMTVDGNSVLRVIHYPPLKERFIPGAVRAAEHEDINFITLLCEGTSGGLELLTRDGEWIPVDTLRGQIVVDSGDMLSRVTNNVIPATTHRVVNPPSPAEDTVRYSMPFFVHPYSDCSLKPLPSMETPDNPARHPPITADAFLKQRLRELGFLK
ncbi:isopenicillin N synthase family oxygenase [Corallococcus sp. H22C18031201]|nr:isopenicillin N synthase family oxygenase [Corallococcus sp. H22C18031201]